jgi:UDP-N-acetylglucosamine transferase subunit ALG13
VIFVTVGTDLPFDRMMRVVDQWAADTGRKDIFAQIGETEWRPRHMSYSKFLDPPEFVRRFESATTIISHAGMGTILSALRYQKPILVMPRRASLGEQRNEHQLATARRLSEMGKISVAFDEAALRRSLDHLDQFQTRAKIEAVASADLLAGIRQFIFNEQSGAIVRKSSPRRMPVEAGD